MHLKMFQNWWWFYAANMLELSILHSRWHYRRHYPYYIAGGTTVVIAWIKEVAKRTIQNASSNARGWYHAYHGYFKYNGNLIQSHYLMRFLFLLNFIISHIFKSFLYVSFEAQPFSMLKIQFVTNFSHRRPNCQRNLQGACLVLSYDIKWYHMVCTSWNRRGTTLQVFVWCLP